MPTSSHAEPNGSTRRRKLHFSVKSLCWKVARSIALAYGLLILTMVGCQRSMIYYPEKESASTLKNRASKQGLEAWTDDDGQLIGWKTPASATAEDTNAVVIFHGNAGYALHRNYFVTAFQDMKIDRSWQIYLFEYPGYGARDGKPSENAIKNAAVDAVKPLLDTQGAVYLTGESLGAGVACHLAGRFPNAIDGLLLITPFPNLASVGRHHYPYLPVNLLLRDRFNNKRSLEAYNARIAFVVAEQDQVIPPNLGVELHDSYDGPKQMWRLSQSGHNTISYHHSAQWWTEAVKFLAEDN